LGFAFKACLVSQSPSFFADDFIFSFYGTHLWPKQQGISRSPFMRTSTAGLIVPQANDYVLPIDFDSFLFFVFS